MEIVENRFLLIAVAMSAPRKSCSPETGPRRAGVTLIELLTVLVIISIMAVGASMAFRSFTRGAGIEGATRSVASTLSQCRQYAITHRERIKFAYSNATSNGFHWSTYSVVDVYDNILISPQTNPYGVVFDNAPGDLTFKSDGSLPGANQPKVVLKEEVPGGKAAVKTISVNPMTGYIRVLSD